MNITMTGNLGSGKTSVCRELEESGFTIISAGDIFRDIAAERGISIIELNEEAKKDRSIDDLVDKRSTDLGKKMDHTVFDSRLAWHFVEKSFKVFLLVDTQEAARRVFSGNNRSAEAYRDEEEAREGLTSRAKLERERYAKLYGLDYYDASNYDLIIESTFASPGQIAEEIKRNFELYRQEPFHAKVELNIKSLYPTKSVKDMDMAKIAAYRDKEEKENESLCGMAPVSVAVKDGYCYIGEGHHHTCAASGAGKVFAEVKDMRQGQALTGLAEEEYGSFGKLGNFAYGADPACVPVKAGYMVDFSKIFAEGKDRLAGR